MAAQGSVPTFNTLKECLEFLEWLRDRRSLQSSVANRLKRLLEKKYDKVNEQQIANALSMFLGHVSNFHSRLCKNPGRSKYTPDRTRDALYALLQCIPKVLSAMYFLRYHVDYNFDKVGGGDWAKQNFGMVAMYARIRLTMDDLMRRATDIEKYFITQNGSMYGVIPGGFDPNELKQIGEKGSYSEGRLMTNDLVNIFDKERNPNNLFRDVFVMSVLSKNFGVDGSNVANALRMVEDFCGIFGAETNEDEFKSHVQSRGKCINWGELKQHCADLKNSLGKLFTKDQFSFTGYGRTYGYLDKKNIAKKMASWLKKNLPEMKNILAQIQPLHSKYKTYNLKKPNPQLTQYYTDLGAHLTKHLFPYGFTFSKTHFGSQTTPYKNMQTVWDTVIGMLKKNGGGLDELKRILDGTACPNIKNYKEHKPKVEHTPKTEAEPGPKADPDPDPEPEDDLDDEDDVDSDEELMKELSDEEDLAAQKTEATKTEAAKTPVHNVNGDQAQGKKSEGAQNQGKKAEGAQNQGKKAEGTPDQGNGATAAQSPSSPVKQAVQTQNPSAPSTGRQSTGAPGSDSDQGPVGQAVSPGASQASDQAPQAGIGDSNTSRSQPTAIGGDGVGRGGSSGISNKCPGGKAPIQLWPNSDSKYCPSNVDTNKHEDVYKAWTPEPQITDKGAQYPKNSRITDSYTTTNQSITHLLGSPRQHTAGPGTGRALYEPGEWRRRQGGRIAETDIPSLDVTGDPIVHSRDHQNNRLLAQRRKNDANRLNMQKLANQQKLAYEDKARIREIEKQKQNAAAVWQQQAQKASTRAAKYYHDVARIQKTLKQGKKDAEERKRQEEAEKREKQEEEELQMKLMYKAYYDYANSFDGQPAPDPTDFILMKQEAANVRKAYREEEEKQKMKDRQLKKVLDAARKMNVPQLKAQPIHKPPLFMELDGHAPAILNQVDGSSLTSDSKGGANIPTSHHVTPPRPLMPDFKGTVISDSNLDSSIPKVYLEHPPPIRFEMEKAYKQRKTPEPFEIDIHVPKLTLSDNDLDFELDFDDDSTHIKDDTLPNPIAPFTHAISLDLPPPNIEQSLPPCKDFDPDIIKPPTVQMCLAPWAASTPTPGSPDIPETELFPSEAPRTVRDMLTWLAGLRNEKHHDALKQCIKRAFGGSQDDPSQLALSINHAKIRPVDVFDILQLTAMFAGSVLSSIAPTWKANVPSKTVKPMSYEDPDCCALLGQLRDYVYACCHQLQFLKSQCKRDKSHGGWKSHDYGNAVSPSDSPLQAFLTDDWDSGFKTHPFDPCNLCHKSRVRMGFKKEDLPSSQQTGKTLSSILTPSCGGSDPLLTLCSYVNCITRRTPRTTGELVSYFHHFGNELHGYDSESLSSLGTALSTSHPNCPEWDRLDGTCLNSVRGIRGTEPVISIHNSKHDHPRTLSTLVGCGSDSSNCPQHCSPITYRAYALYSQSFVHTYLSWAVYLPDRLRESLEKLYCDLKKHNSFDGKSLHSCSIALPLLYLHGFTPPEVESQLPLKCSDVIAKLEEIVNGGPIASLMTAMDNFLYNIRIPFIFTLVALWSLAFLIFANTALYRLDVLRIRSHLTRSRGSHVIDVKALLTDGTTMPSLYDIDYFDEDTVVQLGV